MRKFEIKTIAGVSGVSAEQEVCLYETDAAELDPADIVRKFDPCFEPDDNPEIVYFKNGVLIFVDYEGTFDWTVTIKELA